MITEENIRAAIPNALQSVSLPQLGELQDGKVRDMYCRDGKRALITTDRVSAFDRVLGTIPFKGQVLTQLSAWWFEQLSDVVAHHVAAVPDPNVIIGYEADPLPVEVIVRGYITGSTSTSLWTLYNDGVDRPYGLELPVGLVKNARLPEPVITPTTKAAKGEHDERLTCDEVVEHGLVEPELWAEVQRVSLEIFRRGQAVAQKAGLILVDTKYEFGMIDGKLSLIDEVHTPDSSRYWVAETYEAAMAEGRAPQQFDKEHLRLWLGRQGYKGDGPAPELADDIVAEVSARYISAYERLTGLDFVPGAQPPAPRIARHLTDYFGVES
jgi:phosphoribosylaminoimidazole-succinocarboxamide synthase